MQTAIGIDPSLSNTAICFYTPNQGIQPHTPHTECRNAGEAVQGMARFKRYERLVNSVFELCAEAKPGIVMIEGYSYASTGGRAIVQAEFGGLLRYRLLQFELVEVTPLELKKWATGKGKGTKVPVIVSLTKRYGVEYDTDDEYDAFALAKIGAQYQNWEKSKTAYEAGVVSKLKERIAGR